MSKVKGKFDYTQIYFDKKKEKIFLSYYLIIVRKLVLYKSWLNCKRYSNKKILCGGQRHITFWAMVQKEHKFLKGRIFSCHFRRHSASDENISSLHNSRICLWWKKNPGHASGGVWINIILFWIRLQHNIFDLYSFF